MVWVTLGHTSSLRYGFAKWKLSDLIAGHDFFPPFAPPFFPKKDRKKICAKSILNIDWHSTRNSLCSPLCLGCRIDAVDNRAYAPLVTPLSVSV